LTAIPFIGLLHSEKNLGSKEPMPDIPFPIENKKKQLKITIWNVCKGKNKSKPHINYLLATENPDIFFLMEPYSQFHFNNYTGIYQSDKYQTQLHIKNDIKFTFHIDEHINIILNQHYKMTFSYLPPQGLSTPHPKSNAWIADFNTKSNPRIILVNPTLDSKQQQGIDTFTKIWSIKEQFIEGVSDHPQLTLVLDTTINPEDFTSNNIQLPFSWKIKTSRPPKKTISNTSQK